MKESLKRRTELFVGNELKLIRGLRWDNFVLFPIVASIFTDKGQEVDIEKLKKCRELIDTNTSILSSFRGNFKLPFSAILAVSEEPLERIKETKIYYDMLKEKFSGTPYTALVAGSLGKLTTVSEAPEYIAKGRNIYDGMKHTHPLLTSEQDSVLATLLAFSEKSEAELLVEMELLFKGVTDYVSDPDTIQSVSHVLTITGDDYKAKLDKFKKVSRTFMPEGKNYRLGVEAIPLAALTILPVDADTIISDLRDIEAFLKTKKGYGFFGFSRHDRRAHAAMILAAHYSEFFASQNVKDTVKAAEVANSLAILAAQQVVICACIGATATAVHGKI